MWLPFRLPQVCSDGFVSVAPAGPAPAPAAGAPLAETAEQMLERVKLDSLNVSVAVRLRHASAQQSPLEWWCLPNAQSLADT